MHILALLLLGTTTTMTGKAPTPPINGGIVERNPGGDPQKKDSPVLIDKVEAKTEISEDLHDVDKQIKKARKSGTMTKAEARSYRRNAYLIRKLTVDYSRDGFSEVEAAELKARTAALRSMVFAPQ